jgi:hypothetical protein
MTTCEYCGTTFSQKCSLIKHQKTARFCLKIRNSNSILLTSEKIEYENKINILTEKIKARDDTIVQLREQITVLQNKLENIAIQGVKKCSVVTNTNIVLQPLTSEWLNTQASLLSRSDIEKGLVGYAEFAKNYSFKDRIKCSDFSRKKLEFIEEDGTLIKDNKGNRVAKLFFQSIQTQNQEIISKIQDDILKQVAETSSQTETMYLLEKMTDIVNISRGVKKVSQGESDIIKDDFIRELCNVLR